MSTSREKLSNILEKYKDETDQFVLDSQRNNCEMLLEKYGLKPRWLREKK
jgi:hypothetical protein